jgi:ABC-type polysaccharide transport system permease subunit
LARRYEGGAVKKFIQTLSYGFEHWFSFVLVSGLEPTNNCVERALREPVVQRKIMGTLRNQKGTEIYETLMTLIATWKKQGLDLHDKMAESLLTAWSRS